MLREYGPCIAACHIFFLLDDVPGDDFFAQEETEDARCRARVPQKNTNISKGFAACLASQEGLAEVASVRACSCSLCRVYSPRALPMCCTFFLPEDSQEDAHLAETKTLRTWRQDYELLEAASQTSFNLFIKES